MEEIVKMLVGSGPIGAVLAWFLWVNHNDLRRMEQAINRLVHLDTLRLISSPHVGPELKEAASVLLTEVSEAQKANP